ncbi:MAG: hypothetical protein IJ659_00170 [Alloprevotella sp.]|nr:hypothetical protein [Alloprevotella sp.]
MRTVSALPFLLFFGLLTGVFAAISPWVGDDIEYAYVASASSPNMTDEPIQDIGDVVRSQINHYQGVNGRTVAHFFVQSFCGLWGQAAFAVCAGLMAALLLFLLMKVGRVNLRDPSQCFLTLLLALSPFYLYYTPCCQIGYVWTACLTLLAHHLMESPPGQLRWGFLLLLFGLVAGWGQEAFNFGLCGAWLLMALTGRVRRVNALLLLLGFTGGCVLIGLSPGAWQRASEVTTSLSGSLQLLAVRLRTFYVLAAFMLYLWVRRQASPWQMLRSEPVLFTALLLCFAFNLFIGVIGARQLFGIELFSMLLLLRLMAHFEVPAARLSTVIGLLTFALTFMLLRRGDYLLQTRQAYDRTMELALSAPDGATVLHRYSGGDALWPGPQFLETMEKKVRTQTGRNVHIVPACSLPEGN